MRSFKSNESPWKSSGSIRNNRQYTVEKNTVHLEIIYLSIYVRDFIHLFIYIFCLLGRLFTNRVQLICSQLKLESSPVCAAFDRFKCIKCLYLKHLTLKDIYRGVLMYYGIY